MTGMNPSNAVAIRKDGFLIPPRVSDICYSFYLTATRSLVDIAGYLPFFATFKVTTHEAAALGAFSFVPTMKHGPVSFHVFLPFDTLVRRRDKRVDDFFATVDFFTVKPGRALNERGFVATCPVSDDELIAKSYFTPFANPSTTHEVCAVRQTTVPLPEVTTYVIFDVDATALHDNEIDLFKESEVADAGASGGPTGVPVTVTAVLVPKALAPTTDTEYSVPFVRPVIVHVVVVVEHVNPPGVAVAV
jgi:hypothetical protein